MLSSILPSLLGLAAKSWFKPVLTGIAVAAVSALLVSVFIYIRNAEEAKAAVPVLQKELAAAQADTRSNQEAFESCKATNDYNAREAELQRNRASMALSEVEKLRNKANSNVQVVNHEAQKFRQRNLACPALDRDFRRWVLNDM